MIEPRNDKEEKAKRKLKEFADNHPLKNEQERIKNLEEENKHLRHEVKELRESSHIAYMYGYEKGRDLNNAN